MTPLAGLVYVITFVICLLIVFEKGKSKVRKELRICKTCEKSTSMFGEECLECYSRKLEEKQ